MRSLECPNCKNQVCEFWEILILPSRFWLKKRCRHCDERIRFNPTTILWLVGFLVIGIGVSNILSKLLSIESELFGVVVFVLFTCYPLAAGKKLFSQAQSESDRGKGKGEAGNRY